MLLFTEEPCRDIAHPGFLKFKVVTVVGGNVKVLEDPDDGLAAEAHFLKAVNEIAVVSCIYAARCVSNQSLHQ